MSGAIGKVSKNDINSIILQKRYSLPKLLTATLLAEPSVLIICSSLSELKYTFWRHITCRLKMGQLIFIQYSQPLSAVNRALTYYPLYGSLVFSAFLAFNIINHYLKAVFQSFLERFVRKTFSGKMTEH